MRFAALGVLAIAAIGGEIRFEEIAARGGLHFGLRNSASGQFHMVELMPGGVAALDYDNDGCMDVFFANGAALPPLRKTTPAYHNRLFRNNCDLTFTDVTAKARLEGEGYSMAVAAADYDNDGNTDLFVAGVNRNQLFRNRGDGTFEDVTAKARIEGADPALGKMWSIAAGWFDMDNDGWLDLFVSSYVDWDPAREPQCGTPALRAYCHPSAFEGRPHQLFRSRRDGTFEDISASSGISRYRGKGMGVAFADYNQDGRTDIFVGNDTVRNFLFENLGGGKFREVGLEAGVSLGENGRAVATMGVDFRDYDNDGLPDIALTANVNDTYLLFRNRPSPQFFDDATIPSGLSAATKQLTGWGMGMYDFDNDGWKDLFFANSHFPQIDRYLGEPSPLPNRVFRNDGRGKFLDVTDGAGVLAGQRRYWRGAAFADFDRDGRIDVVVSAMNAPAALFRNITEGSGHWLALRLRGTRANRDAIGAQVEVTLEGGVRLFNHVSTSVGYASSSEPLVRVGLGGHTRAATVEIRWPGGKKQVLSDVAGDRVVEVREQ